MRPDVHPVAWSDGLPGWMSHYGWLDRFDESFVGFVVGSLIGVCGVSRSIIDGSIEARERRAAGRDGER